MTYLRTLLLLSSICFVGCYSDEPNSRTKEELIAGSNAFGKIWEIRGIEADLGDIVGVFQTQDCKLDNFITYFPSGRYEDNEGRTKCNPNDQLGYIGRWFFTNRETQLVVEIGDSTRVWDIESINSSSHRITSSFPNGLRTYELISSN